MKQVKVFLVFVRANLMLTPLTLLFSQKMSIGRICVSLSPFLHGYCSFSIKKDLLSISPFPPNINLNISGVNLN